MSPHLTSSLSKENCQHPYCNPCPLPAHPLPIPCSCLVWLGRQTRGLREGFMKEEACDGRGSQRGQCERRPGGDLGKCRPMEKTSRDPGSPLPLCSFDFHLALFLPLPWVPSLCLCPHPPEAPLGPALISPTAPAWYVYVSQTHGYR